MILKITLLVIANTALSVLAILFLAGEFAAPYHWVADLLSHFQLQYALALVLLAIPFAAYKKFVRAALCLLLAVGGIYNIYTSYDHVSEASQGKPVITFVQYNRFHRNDNYADTVEWLKQNADKFDVISLQETTPKAREAYKALESIYPYTYPDHLRHYTDILLMSRYPFQDEKFLNMSIPGRGAPHALYVRVMHPDVSEGISLYAVHTASPKTFWRHKQRNQQLGFLAKAIAGDTHDHIVFLGDLNITPYSPYFRGFIQNSGMKNQLSGIFPIPTWPSVTAAPFLQIPIDHILHKGKLSLLDKGRKDAMDSDHYPVMATFEILP